MAITDAAGLPVAVCLASASTHEVKLAETVIDSLFIAEKPEKLIGDKAYDSDKFDNDLLKKHGVEMIAHRIAATARSQKLRMDERSGCINAAGKSSGVSLGCKTLEGWLLDMSGMLIVFCLFCCLHAQLISFFLFCP